MKNCYKCGNELYDDAMYCPNCGEQQPLSSHEVSNNQLDLEGNIGASQKTAETDSPDLSDKIKSIHKNEPKIFWTYLAVGIFSLFLLIVMISSCGKGSAVSNNDPKTNIKNNIQSYATVSAALGNITASGDKIKSITTNTVDVNIKGQKWTATGNFSAMDVYGTTIRGTFDASGTINEATGSVSVSQIKYKS